MEIPAASIQKMYAKNVTATQNVLIRDDVMLVGLEHSSEACIFITYHGGIRRQRCSNACRKQIIRKTHQSNGLSSN